MVPRPCALLSSRSSCCSLTDSAVGLTCWAPAGTASPAIMSTTAAATRIRIRAMSLVMVLSPCDRLPPAGAGHTDSPTSVLLGTELRQRHHVAMVSRYATCQPQAPEP